MKSRGFTLLELMVTVAIVGILASVALPWYGQYVQKGNRSDAMSPLQSIMDAEERYYADNVTYTTDLTELGFSTSTTKGLYTIKARACTSSAGTSMALTQCIELYATAVGNQASDGDLVMNSLGRQERILGSQTYDWE